MSVYNKKIQVTSEILYVIIQQIVTLSKYGHDALDICHLTILYHSVYQAIYVASYVGRKSEAKKCRQKDLKMLRVLLSIC